MKDGFIRVACASPAVSVADTDFNTAQITSFIDSADAAGVNLLVLPELAVTGATCADLFFSDKLISAAKAAIVNIAEHTKGKYTVAVFGAPIAYNGKLYNCAVVVCNGSILGIVPKAYLNGNDKRFFASSADLELSCFIDINGVSVPFCRNMVFKHESLFAYSFSVEVGDSVYFSQMSCRGASVVANLAAVAEIVGKAEAVRTHIKSLSKREICGFVFASASQSESTQDVVYSGQNIIAENGKIIAQNAPFESDGLLISEIDVSKLDLYRRKMSEFSNTDAENTVYFEQKIISLDLVRRFPENPFVPHDKSELNEHVNTVFNIQSYGLKKRIEHINASKLVIGISGGLDSTLALLVAVNSLKLLNRPASDVLAVTMPCFGTTDRTRSNAVKLCDLLGVSLREIAIGRSVEQHFTDIGQDKNKFDAAYENSQARERTQVLMDIANMTNGLVVGTGDLSELALGWATYNGDHMSMYAVNADVPKTMVRAIVSFIAERSSDKLAKVLLDILDTPVSPELLPVKDNGDLGQKTEDLVGPYDLHDFFIYYTLKYNFSPAKIYRLAKATLGYRYSDADILYWLKVFVRRFFTQQFKRSCMPDGPKVGSVGLSPRGDYMMPSDASYNIWLNELENL